MMKIDPCFYLPSLISTTGVTGASAAIVNEPAFAKTGLYSVKAMGTTNSGSAASHYYKLSETKIAVKAAMQLSFWKYSVNALGQYTSVDLVFQSGKRLKNLPAYVDQNGNALTPAIARGTIGVWEKFTCQLGAGELIGDVLTGILIGYDHPSASGNYTAYFDDIIVEDAPVSLPVTFLSVAALRLRDGSVSIHWQVADEIAMKDYTVERSEDGISFTAIQTLPATGGNRYKTVDYQSIPSAAYYRIKTLSLNGTSSYSTMEYISPFTTNSSLELYPNPVKEGGKITLKLVHPEPGNYQIRWYNFSGQMVFQTTQTVNVGSQDAIAFELPAQLSSGTYLVDLISTSGTRTVHKMVVGNHK